MMPQKKQLQIGYLSLAYLDITKGLNNMAKTITIFFSIKGQTLSSGMKIVEQEKGNTAIAAEFIHNAVGGELFEIETARVYSKDHMTLINEAKQELEAGTRVEVKKYPENLEEYDTIFLVYPNWWNTMPMVMFTFLEHYDWSGKRIIPFCTNEGSGLGESVRDIKKIVKGAAVKDGRSLTGSQVKNMEDKILAWAKEQLQVTANE